MKFFNIHIYFRYFLHCNGNINQIHIIVSQLFLGSRLCASTLIVYYEDKEVKLGIQRSCASEDRDQNIRDGYCNTKTVNLII